MNRLQKVELACAAALVLAAGSIPVFTQAGHQNAKFSDIQKKVAAYTSVDISVGAVPKSGLSKEQKAQILQIATEVVKANGNRLADDGPGGRPDGPGGRPDGPGGRPDGPGGRPDGPGGRPDGPGGRPA